MTAQSSFPPLPKPAKPHYAGKVAVRRALDMAKKGGIDVAGLEMLPDGTIRILDARLAPKPEDDLFDKFDREGKL